MDKIINFFYKNMTVIAVFLVFWLLSMIYFRKCETMPLFDVDGLFVGNYPTSGWNFFVKENSHFHWLFLDLILLNFLNTKLLRCLLWVDIIFCLEKILTQITGLIFAGQHAPGWCNQRMIGFIMTFSIIINISIFYKGDITFIIKNKIWRRIFGIS